MSTRLLDGQGLTDAEFVLHTVAAFWACLSMHPSAANDEEQQGGTET